MLEIIEKKDNQIKERDEIIERLKHELDELRQTMASSDTNGRKRLRSE